MQVESNIAEIGVDIYQCIIGIPKFVFSDIYQEMRVIQE
jgi:hypothetical protein